MDNEKEKISPVSDGDEIDRNVRLMSPTGMVVRRFFRSKLSIIGLAMIIGLFLFCWAGPLIYDAWGPREQDVSGKTDYNKYEIQYEKDGKTYTFYQVVEEGKTINALAGPSKDHLLGTDKEGQDVFTRLMHGGRVSLTLSFFTVFVITLIGVIFGGIAGYFGGVVDNVIMRICDILMCLPGFPILLIVGTILQAANANKENPLDPRMNLYLLMGFLTLISWTGTARLVRGQILSLREQEYMVAAEAMGYSATRKIFKHLVPNVMPQLIVTMTLSLGSMILYEASLSYLGIGVSPNDVTWGRMINIVAEDQNILQNFFNVWGPPGICIIIAVLGFNFVGDGLRDALDPRMRR